MKLNRFGSRPSLLLLFLFTASLGYAIDVEINVPELTLDGDLAQLSSFLEQATGFDLENEINGELNTAADNLETEIEGDEDIDRFSEFALIGEGFANAGATASHLGTPRSFIDYRSFAVVIGTGISASAPGIDAETLVAAAEDVEEEGDIYVGAALQPITGGLGVNISRFVPRTRAYFKFGYFDIPYGTVADEIAFNSMSVGFGGTYQLLQSRQLPLGFVRWRGLSLGSGLLFQQNTTNIEITLSEQTFETDPITLGDAGLDAGDIPPGSPFTPDDELGSLIVPPPVIEASIESRTYSVPLEVNTGLRLLWLLDVNVGAGVDLVFGSSDIALGAGAGARFEPPPALDDQLSVSDGSVSFSVSSNNSPQFLRPRLTAGAGLNLGPVKLDVPVMLYFDGEGNSVMAGVNVGIVW